MAAAAAGEEGVVAVDAVAVAHEAAERVQVEDREVVADRAVEVVRVRAVVHRGAADRGMLLPVLRRCRGPSNRSSSSCSLRRRVAAAIGKTLGNLPTPGRRSRRKSSWRWQYCQSARHASGRRHSAWSWFAPGRWRRRDRRKSRPGGARPSTRDVQNFLDLPNAGGGNFGGGRVSNGLGNAAAGFGGALAGGAAAEFLSNRPSNALPGEGGLAGLEISPARCLRTRAGLAVAMVLAVQDPMLDVLASLAIDPPTSDVRVNLEIDPLTLAVRDSPEIGPPISAGPVSLAIAQETLADQGSQT